MILSNRQFDAGAALEAAALYAQTGDIARAESLYRSVLEAQPRNAELIHILAALAFQRRDYSSATDLAQRGLKINGADPAFHNLLGRACKAQGKFADAIKAYRRALYLDPGRPELHVSLGIALRAQGKLDEAVACYRQALRLAPDYPVALHNLANALLAAGDLKKAEEGYERIIELHPNFAEAHFELGNLARWRRDREAALLHYRRALELGVGEATIASRLGNGLKRLGELRSAAQAFERAVELSPDGLDGYFHLGGVLYDLREYDAAITVFARALSVNPGSAGGLTNLGVALRGRGRRQEAMACFNRALEREPDLAEAHVNLGILLGDYNSHAESEHHLDEALRLAPDDPETLVCSALVKRHMQKYAEAFALCGRALARDPSHMFGHVNLGILQVDTGSADLAIESLGHALGSPVSERDARSTLMMALSYTDLDPGHILEEHHEFDRRHAVPLRSSPPERSKSLEQGRIRLGYVSPDFRNHSVAYFIEPLLANHDRNRFEIHCYHTHLQTDTVTERLRSYCDAWTDCTRLSDEELAEQIRDDGIDVLVDLAGHTAGNRLLAFARKPAPIQITWLGYPTTTGLSAFDYRVSDWQVDPQGYEAFNAEKVLRLPNSYFCYRPPAEGPEVSGLPCLSSGRVTFGSFNNLSKIGAGTIALWAKALCAVPDSRLVLKNKAFGDAWVRARIAERFESNSIDPSRIEMRGWENSSAHHLALYHEVDIGLDPFPYNGATTTCEALWMGVPVVSLAGRTHASRMGLSILTAAGLPEFVVSDDAAFVEICRHLAADPAGLARLRGELRRRLQASTLTNGPAFACGFESALSLVCG